MSLRLGPCDRSNTSLLLPDWSSNTDSSVASISSISSWKSNILNYLESLKSSLILTNSISNRSNSNWSNSNSSDRSGNSYWSSNFTNNWNCVYAYLSEILIWSCTVSYSNRSSYSSYRSCYGNWSNSCYGGISTISNGPNDACVGWADEGGNSNLKNDKIVIRICFFVLAAVIK